jgi:hypothetical protein
MKFKEFYKPTKIKLLISAIILIAPFCSAYVAPCFVAPCPEFGFCFPVLLFSVLSVFGLFGTIWLILVPALAISILISYTAACLLAAAYHRKKAK